MPGLSQFIRDNVEPILQEWEAFARSLSAGESMDIESLRDHAKEMLVVIADDLERPQTPQAKATKAEGRSDASEHHGDTAAQEHGSGRAGSGFTIAEMVSEFRALRASVTRLWLDGQHQSASRDIQELIRFNEAIDQAIAESVARYSQTIGQTQERFLAILSHDLRTPLGAVITSTSFMRESDDLGEPYRTLVARVESSARRMNQMVVDLLEFARTRFGDAIPIVRGRADVRKLAHDVVLEISTLFPACTVQIETSGDLYADLDGDRLSQALTNLVSNAVHHGEPDAPIRVVAQGFPQEVLVAVNNRGPAIPAEHLPRIFQAGARGAGRGGDHRHLGLGLYIVEKIVAAHGGTITVTSTAESGTSFVIRLPRRVEAPASSPAPMA